MAHPKYYMNPALIFLMADAMTDNATYQAHKEYEKEGTPIPIEKQRRADNLNTLRERLQSIKTRALETMSNLMDEKGSSYLIENYLSIVIECDAKLTTLSKYEWHLLENRVSEL